jgi:pimeloyl-ACP methyl ester carboxylesterase
MSQPSIAIRSTADLHWGSISYVEWPAAPTASASTVLLLHGGGVDNASLSWGGVGPRLAEAGYRVIAPDHPGYGQSPSAPWPATQQRLVDYVGEFVDELELGPHVTGGLSLGGGMAIGHTLARSDTVTGAMLLGSYGLMPRLSDGLTSLPQQVLTWAMLRTGLLTAMTRRMAGNRAALNWSMASLVRDRAQRTPELMDEVWAAAETGHGFAAFEQWQRSQILLDRLATDYRSELAHITAPVLIVHGDRDTGVPVERARSAAAAIPDATLEIVAGAGHWVQRDQPDVAVAAMLGFLGRLSAAA